MYDSLDILEVGLVFEIEKAWHYIDDIIEREEKRHNMEGITDRKRPSEPEEPTVVRKEKVKLLNSLQENVYGWQVQSEVDKRPERVVRCVNFYEKLFVENKHKLDSDDQKFYEEVVLAKLRWKKEKAEETQKCYPPIKKSGIDPKNHELRQKYKDELKNPRTEKILNAKVPRDVYIEFIKLFYSIYGIDKWIVLNTGIDTFKDSDDSLQISAKKKYQELPLIDLCYKLQHEIDIHMSTQTSNDKNLWNIKGKWQMLKEEWLATLSDTIIVWWNINDVEEFIPLDIYPQILVWELIGGDDYLRFLDIHYNKLTDLNRDPAWTFLRRIRNFCMFLPWTQQKDKSYYEWVNNVIDYLLKWEWIDNEWDKLLKLFIWNVDIPDIKKFSFPELDDSLRIVKSEPWEKIWVNHLSIPIFLGEFILWYVAEWKFDPESFIKRVQEKYFTSNFLDESVDPEKFWNHIRKTLEEHNQEITEILDIVDEHISKLWLDQYHDRAMEILDNK